MSLRSSPAFVLSILAFSVMVLLVPTQHSGTALAFDRYNDGCQSCHGEFTGPVSPAGTMFPDGDKHRMHRHSASMATECDLCHTTGDDWDPFLGSSNGTAINPGVGCNGCHGRDYGGTIGHSGVGLRAHHATAGVTSCTGCHPSDPTPLPEDVPPIYYGTADTRVDDPCNSAPDFRENWSIGDTLGSDNDGDGVYDEADSDCAGGCAGDIDGDGDTDLGDLAALLASYTLCDGDPGFDAAADFDSSGCVDLSDLAFLLADYLCGT